MIFAFIYSVSGMEGYKYVGLSVKNWSQIKGTGQQVNISLLNVSANRVQAQPTGFSKNIR